MPSRNAIPSSAQVALVIDHFAEGLRRKGNSLMGKRGEYLIELVFGPPEHSGLPGNDQFLLA